MTELKKRQLKRAKDFIRRAEKRGYKFASSFKENLPKLTTRKLKSMTPEDFYSHATKTIGNVNVSGTRARDIERIIANKKREQTRARKKFYEEHPDYEQSLAESYEETTIVHVEALIAEYKNSSTETDSRGAKMLEAELKAQIATYGRKKVAQALNNAPERSIASAERVIFGSTDEQKQQGITELMLIIRGDIPDVDESKAIGEAMDLDDSNYMQNESTEV